MSQFDDDDDFESGSDSISEVRKAKRADEKRIKELEKELSGFRTDARKRTLSEAIKDKGLNPKIAAFVPSDVDVAGIEEWLTEYGDVFAPAGTAPPAVLGDGQVNGSLAPDGADTFNQVANSGTAPLGDEGQLMARIAAAQTAEELNVILGLA
jgi:hypothetical protein